MSHHQSYYYLMGCYTFSSAAPFKIQSMTTLPIIHKDLYSLRFNHRKILYPSGIVENHKQYVVACGENDEHIVFVTVDKEKLLKELKEIRT